MSKRLAPNRLITFIISLSFFMESVDSTVINTAIPAISHSLHVDPVDVKVALISYLLGLAIFIPISGWLADKFGAKKIFITALFIFTLSSLWCGFCNHLMELIIARFVQGLGGALGLPVGHSAPDIPIYLCTFICLLRSGVLSAVRRSSDMKVQPPAQMAWAAATFQAIQILVD